MMMRIAAIAALSMLSAFALARAPDEGPPVEPNVVATGGDANAIAISGAHAESAAISGSVSGASVEVFDASRTTAYGGEANNAGNSQTLSVSSRYEEKRQAPGVYAPAIYASGPCAYGWSAGASIPGGGASFGKSKPDANCDRRELARVLTPLNPRLALKVLCTDPLIRDVAAAGMLADDDCVYYDPPAVVIERKPTTEGPLDPRYATPKYVDDVAERVLKDAVRK